MASSASLGGSSPSTALPGCTRHQGLLQGGCSGGAAPGGLLQAMPAWGQCTAPPSSAGDTGAAAAAWPCPALSKARHGEQGSSGLRARAPLRACFSPHKPERPGCPHASAGCPKQSAFGSWHFCFPRPLAGCSCSQTCLFKRLSHFSLPLSLLLCLRSSLAASQPRLLPASSASRQSSGV